MNLPLFFQSYSVIWNEHFEQWAFGCNIKLSSKSYNLATLVTNGAPHFGHFKPPAPFKINSFKLSIISCETVYDEKSFSNAFISCGSHFKTFARFCLTVTGKNNSFPASMSSIKLNGKLHSFAKPFGENPISSLLCCINCANVFIISLYMETPPLFKRVFFVV